MFIGTDISTLSNLNKVPSLGTMSVIPSTSLIGNASYGYLPFDKGDFKTMTGDESPHDNGTTYTANTSTSYVHIPSPYSGDSRNPLYYDTATVTTANCLSDFDGVGNTDKIITQRGTKDYNSWNPTYNAESDYPAASCCDMFYTEGTKQGDWYLPACGELSYMIPRFNAICTSIAALIAAYGSEVGVQLSSNGGYWSSSEYSSGYARYVLTYSGYVYDYCKSSDYYVRAFLRVG